ncbi:hypothetical protein B0H13DRAFT_1856584 [Mycena leptocephala]|nr:hypothetical protein B0H13DRAFT_1856584 [Mycena leptocephala]
MPQSSSPTPPLLSLSKSPTKSPRTVRRVRWDKFRPIAPLILLRFASKFERRAEQQVDTTRKPRKMRRCGDRARDDSEVNPKDTETRIRDPGRHFALMWCSRFMSPASVGVKARMGYLMANPSSRNPSASNGYIKSPVRRQPSTGQSRRRMTRPVILPFPIPEFASLLDKPATTVIELPAPIISSTMEPTVHHFPDTDHSSACVGCEAPICTTRGCKQAIIPAGCSPEPLSKQHAAWTANCSVIVAAIMYFYI